MSIHFVSILYCALFRIAKRVMHWSSKLTMDIARIRLVLLEKVEEYQAADMHRRSIVKNAAVNTLATK